VSTVSDVPADPRRLMELAQSDPATVLELGPKVISGLASDDHVARSTTLRALGVAARLGGDMSASLRFGEQAVTEAVAGGEPVLRAEALMSLGGSLAFAGDNSRAFQMLDRAAETTSTLLLAEIEFQRGTILGRMGEAFTAIDHLSKALAVFEEHADRESVAMTLHNRAMVQIAAGSLVEAEADMRGALMIDAEDQREIGVAGEVHGLGLIASLRGEIPLALVRFDESAEMFQRLVGSSSEIQVSRCEVLLAAGLFREASSLAESIAADLHRAGLAEDEAEARLVGAQAALLGGDLDSALDWSRSASKMFSDQGRTAWAAVARLIEIEVQLRGGLADRSSQLEARKAAVILERDGQVAGAHRARLLAGMIGSRLGDDETAMTDLKVVAERVAGPIELRLQARLATAIMRLSRGDGRGADAAARSGMRLLDEYQASLGATDIRLGVERHSRDLGELGLSLAIESHDARRVFRWMERTRARALLYRPVTPPDDEELAELLTTLRQVTTELRSTQGDNTGLLLSKQGRTQRAIRDRARLTHGTGQAAGWVDPRSVTDALEDSTMVELAEHGGVLWAVIVRNKRYRLIELGAASEVNSEVESLRFALRRLARGRGSIAAAISVAQRLDDLVLQPLGLADGQVVLVPTPGLYATPWHTLPSCRQRPVTIAPSAELWHRSSLSDRVGKSVLLAAGPDLELSDTEVREVGSLYPFATRLTATESTVGRVHALLDGAHVAHVATHAVFQLENPMFSSLRLVDGDLSVYDIERLDNAPDVVVLSACDSGFTDAHAGQELMGLSAAMLSMGTKSIIASVGLVPDSTATKDLMVELHRGLIAGLTPARALHEAQTGVAGTPQGYIAASSFICIGAG